MSESRIMVCACQHKDQDNIYGKGRRVHNAAPKVVTGGGWRCTVCGSEKGKE